MYLFQSSTDCSYSQMFFQRRKNTCVLNKWSKNFRRLWWKVSIVPQVKYLQENVTSVKKEVSFYAANITKKEFLLLWQFCFVRLRDFYISRQMSQTETFFSGSMFVNVHPIGNLSLSFPGIHLFLFGLPIYWIIRWHSGFILLHQVENGIKLCFDGTNDFKQKYLWSTF